MSLFRKPKKNIQRRVFSENPEDDDALEDKSHNAKHGDSKSEEKARNKAKKEPKKQHLLSFDDDDEEEGEVFQVKKSSYSKKMMRMYEKERKRKESKATREEERSTKDDVIVVVKHRTPSPPPPPILSGRDALCAGKDDLSTSDDDDADEADSHRFSKPQANFERVLASGAIPDAAMIHAARKKRQRARELGDFVPDEPEDDAAAADDDDDDDSDEERIDMAANPTKRDRDRRRERFYDAQDAADEWEDQQIRKGVTASALSTLGNPESRRQNTIATKIEPGVPRTPETILEKLREQYRNAQRDRQKHVEELQQVRRDLMTAAEDLEGLKTCAPKAAAKFRFYQELRGYVADLVECLDEKVGVIAALEQRTLEMMAKKAEWLIERRRQDVRDQADEVSNLGKRVLCQKSVAEEPEKTRRAVEREGRRARRRRARETSGVEPRHVEGMSSDDEMPQQTSSQFDDERDRLRREADAVFADVVDDFASLASVLIRFERWRETDARAYREAYATPCVPKIAAPLVRLHLLFWQPLNDALDLEKTDWYRTLALYGLHDDETETSLAADPDLHLLPTIFETIVVSRLQQIVDRCWDPASSSQTLRLVGVVRRYVRKFPTLGPDSKSLNSLFGVVLQKLQHALEHDVFIPIVPKFAETKNAFFQRQFAGGLKLLRNITSWQGLLDDGKLKQLAVTALLNRYLISAIGICQLRDAVAKTQLVSLVLPRVWLTNEREREQHLAMFAQCVASLVRQIDKDNPLHLESSEILAGILKTLK